MKHLKHLSAATLAKCKGALLPDYDRSKVTTGIVHIGIGNFHRAHEAVYVDRCLAADPGWGIAGVSLRSADVAEALGPQDGLYTVLERNENGTSARVIGSVTNLLPAAKGVDKILAALAAPKTRIASLTVTEKGYCLDQGTGRLNPGHEDVRHDLERPREPKTMPGLLVEALRLRREAGLGPFTLLSCDNLNGNGKMLARLISDFAALHSDRLAQWIEHNISSPSTMVDRIVPATSDEDRAEAEKIIGLKDSSPVATESFSQWVIEDSFVAGRPALADAGVELVSDVAPYEHMKLRMLNCAHSALAYMGQFAGHETVREAVGDTRLSQFVTDLWREEVIPTLDRPRSELDAYAATLLRRFANPAMRHLTRQIAMDGSQKIPQRVLPSIQHRLDHQQSFARLAQVLASWITYLAAGGSRFTIEDPLEPQFAKLRQETGRNLPAFAKRVLALQSVFGTLAGNSAVEAQVLAALNKSLTI